MSYEGINQFFYDHPWGDYGVKKSPCVSESIFFSVGLGYVMGAGFGMVMNTAGARQSRVGQRFWEDPKGSQGMSMRAYLEQTPALKDISIINVKSELTSWGRMMNRAHLFGRWMFFFSTGRCLFSPLTENDALQAVLAGGVVHLAGRIHRGKVSPRRHIRAFFHGCMFMGLIEGGFLSLSIIGDRGETPATEEMPMGPLGGVPYRSRWAGNLKTPGYWYPLIDPDMTGHNYWDTA